jgi:hypothetical protein
MRHNLILSFLTATALTSATLKATEIKNEDPIEVNVSNKTFDANAALNDLLSSGKKAIDSLISNEDLKSAFNDNGLKFEPFGNWLAGLHQKEGSGVWNAVHGVISHIPGHDSVHNLIHGKPHNDEINAQNALKNIPLAEIAPDSDHETAVSKLKSVFENFKPSEKENSKKNHAINSIKNILQHLEDVAKSAVSKIPFIGDHKFDTAKFNPVHITKELVSDVKSLLADSPLAKINSKDLKAALPEAIETTRTIVLEDASVQQAIGAEAIRSSMSATDAKDENASSAVAAVTPQDPIHRVLNAIFGDGLKGIISSIIPQLIPLIKDTLIPAISGVLGRGDTKADDKTKTASGSGKKDKKDSGKKDKKDKKDKNK